MVNVLASIFRRFVPAAIVGFTYIAVTIMIVGSFIHTGLIRGIDIVRFSIMLSIIISLFFAISDQKNYENFSVREFFADYFKEIWKDGVCRLVKDICKLMRKISHKIAL